MNPFSIPANCTCGQPTQTYFSLHAGNCLVWGLHHGLTDVKPVEILLTSEGVLHVGLWTPSDEVDSKATRARITKGAKQWAQANGYADVSRVSDGWTLGRETSQTRLIFVLKK